MFRPIQRQYSLFWKKNPIIRISAYPDGSLFQLIRTRGVLLYWIPYSTTSHTLSLRRCPSSNTKDEIMCSLLRDFAHLWWVSVCKEWWWNGDVAEENKRNFWKRLHLYCFVKHRCLKVIQDWTHSYKSPWNWMGKSAVPPKLHRKHYVGLLFTYFWCWVWPCIAVNMWK